MRRHGIRAVGCVGLQELQLSCKHAALPTQHAARVSGSAFCGLSSLLACRPFACGTWRCMHARHGMVWAARCAPGSAAQRPLDPCSAFTMDFDLATLNSEQVARLEVFGEKVTKVVDRRSPPLPPPPSPPAAASHAAVSDWCIGMALRWFRLERMAWCLPCGRRPGQPAVPNRLWRRPARPHASRHSAAISHASRQRLTAGFTAQTAAAVMPCANTSRLRQSKRKHCAFLSRSSSRVLSHPLQHVASVATCYTYAALRGAAPAAECCRSLCCFGRRDGTAAD